jgi:hypothetical protein
MVAELAENDGKWDAKNLPKPFRPEICPHCGTPCGFHYWIHRALVHPELNPQPPRAEGKPKKKKKN